MYPPYRRLHGTLACKILRQRTLLRRAEKDGRNCGSNPCPGLNNSKPRRTLLKPAVHHFSEVAEFLPPRTGGYLTLLRSAVQRSAISYHWRSTCSAQYRTLACRTARCDKTQQRTEAEPVRVAEQDAPPSTEQQATQLRVTPLNTTPRDITKVNGGISSALHLTGHHRRARRATERQAATQNEALLHATLSYGRIAPAPNFRGLSFTQPSRTARCLTEPEETGEMFSRPALHATLRY